MAADPYADLVPQAQEDERKRKREAPRDPYAELAPGGTAEDVKRAVPWSIPKALTGLFGLPRDVRDLATAGREKLYGYLPDIMQGGVKQLDDAVRMLQPTDIIARNLPGSQDLRKSAEAVTGPWYDPQTRTGKVADTALQTAATMGRNWLTTPGKAAMLTGAMTAGTEGAGALTNDDPVARFIGGGVGGLGPTVANVMRSRPGAVVRDAIGTPSPADEAAAIQLQQRAQAEGVPLMGTEALDRGHNLTSHVLSSLGGGQTLQDFLAQRGGQVDAAVRRGLIAPTRNIGTPSENATRAQRAATEVISGAERDRTAAAQPFYRAARSDIIGPDALEGVARTIADERPHFPLPGQQSALTQFERAIEGRAGMPASTVESLARGARIQAELPTIGATPADKQAAAALGRVREALHEAAGLSPNVQAGRQVYQDFTRNVLDPLNAGPVGKVAGRGFDPAVTPPAQRVTSAVSDANTVRADDIRTLHTQLNAQDRQAFPGIAKTWFENELDAALKPTQAGNTSAAGAKVAHALVGTPQQRENFQEVMRGVAIANGRNPDDVVRGAMNLMQVLERTGRTPGVGSQTASRAEISRELGKSVTGDALDIVSARPLRPWGKRIDDWVNLNRNAELARVLTAPNSVELLVKMAKLRPNGLTMRYYVAAMLGLDEAIAAADGPGPGTP